VRAPLSQSGSDRVSQRGWSVSVVPARRIVMSFQLRRLYASDRLKI
jgi:hypothetical protein